MKNINILISNPTETWLFPKCNLPSNSSHPPKNTIKMWFPGWNHLHTVNSAGTTVCVAGRVGEVLNYLQVAILACIFKKQLCRKQNRRGNSAFDRKPSLQKMRAVGKERRAEDGEAGKERRKKEKSKIEKGKSRLPWAYYNPFAMLTLCWLCPETPESRGKFGLWKCSCCVSIFLKMLVHSLMDWCDQCDHWIPPEFMLRVKQIACRQALGEVGTPRLISVGYSEGTINWSLTICLNASNLLWVVPVVLLVVQRY